MEKNKHFISFVHYHPSLFLMSKEQHCQFWVCYAMLDIWYTVEMVSFWKYGNLVKIEDDPNYDVRIKVTYKYDIVSALRYIYINRHSIIYSNTFSIVSLIIGLIWRRTIFFSHGPVFPSKFTPYFFVKFCFVKFCYLFFTKIRVINENEMQILKNNWLWHKGILLPLVISEEHINTKISNNINILLLWRISHVKNPITILEALKIVVKKFPKIRIFSIWNSIEFRSLEWESYLELIEKYELLDNFILRWELPYSQLWGSDTSIYVNSSIMEWQCMAVFDASILWNALCLPNISSFIGILDNKALYHDIFDSAKLADIYVGILKIQRKSIVL